MQIRVKTLDGKTLPLQVSCFDTVETVKQCIQKEQGHLGHLPQQQVLLHANKLLEDGRTLAEYDIQDQSVLHLVSRCQIPPGTRVVVHVKTLTGKVIALEVAPAEGRRDLVLVP